MYFTRWMCFFALLISADTKKCQKKRGLAIIIDSTMETDKEDFAVQVGVIRALSQQFVANRLSMSVQVYAYGGERCNELAEELDQGFFSIQRRRINTRLELLEHQPSNTTWDYKCSKTMYDKVENTLDDNVVKFGVILAKYDSIKQHMDPNEFEKYDEKGKYYLALVYSSGETSNLRKKISRRSSNIENLVPALMDTICQEPGEIKDRSTIVKVTETTAMPEITPTKTTTKDIQTTSVDKSKSYSSMKLHEQSSSKKIVSQLSIEFSTSVLKKTTSIQVKHSKTINKMSPSKTISTLKVVPSSLFENIISFTQKNSGLSTKPSSIIISPENTSYKLQTSVVVSRTISPSFTIKSSNYVKYSKSKNIKSQKAESSAMTVNPTKSVSLFVSATLVMVNTVSSSAAVITMLSMEQSSSIPVVSSSPVRANSTSINKQSSSTISSTKLTISPSAVVKTNVSTSVISASKSVFLSSTKISSNASNEIFTSFHSAISTSSIMYSSQLPSSKMLSSFKTLSSSPSSSINTAIQTNINTIKNANRSASISASSINFSKSSIMTPSTRNATLPKLASAQSKSVSASSSSSYNVPLYTSELSSFATVTLSSIMMSKVLNKTVVPPILEKSSSQKISTLQTQLLSVSSSTGIKTSQTKIKPSSTKIKPSSTNIKPSSTTVKPSNSKTKMAKSKSKAVSGSLVALSSSMVFIPEVTSSTSYSIALSKTSSLATTKQLMKTSSVDTPSKINILTESPSLVYSTSWVNSTTPLPAIVSRIRSSTSDSSLIVMATSRSSSIAVSSSILSIVIADLKKEIRDFLDAKPTSDQLKDKTWTSDFLKNSSNIIVHVGEEENNTQLTSESNELLLFIEDTLVEIGNHLPPGESLNYQTNETALEITAVDPLTFTGYTFASQKTSNESITLPRSVFSQTIMSEKNVIVGMSYNRLPSMKSSLEGIKYSGRVTAISINPAVVVPLLEPLSYTQNLPEGNYSQYHCVYWDMTDWSSKGCKVGNVNGSIVTCECDHMTPFSVLMQTATFTIGETHRFILSMISYIGCGVSIFCCIALILTFMMCGRLVKVDRNLIHINLAIAIALSNGLFIAADSVYEYKGVCLGVSIVMLYGYLATFFWMLVEGIHVYLMVVKVFKSPRKMTVYMLFGWIVPAVITALSAVKFHKNFTREDFCWLSTENHVIWVFVGPALFIILVNTVILIATLKASHKMGSDESEVERLKKIARLTLLLMPIFGLTWVFGVLSINRQLIVFQYVFTAINAFQGLFIFVCYGLMNNEVRREYSRIKRKSQYYSSSSKSTALTTDNNAMSVYIHPHQRRSFKYGGYDDNATNSTQHQQVKLTRFVQVPASYRAYESEEEFEENRVDTLTKKKGKNYSIELLRIPNNGITEDNSSVGSDEPILSREEVTTNNDTDYAYSTGTFKRTDDNGVVIKAYQV